MICDICQYKVLVVKDDYWFCNQCCHMISIKQEQHFIVNDPLTISSFDKPDLRDRFQLKTISQYIDATGVLLDIGCGPGRFIHFAGKHLKAVYGIEVTESCIDFARSVLKLDVFRNFDQLNQFKIINNVDVVTAWHSLEHIPMNSLPEVVNNAYKVLKNNGYFIVSVPNSSSFQYLIYRKHWLYYDYPHHIHQFSHKSLTHYLLAIGFKEYTRIFSWSYNFFGHLLSWANMFTTENNFLYYMFKRKTLFKYNKFNYLQNIIGSLIGISIGLVPSLLLTALEYLAQSKMGVITICFKKN